MGAVTSFLRSYPLSRLIVIYTIAPIGPVAMMDLAYGLACLPMVFHQLGWIYWTGVGAVVIGLVAGGFLLFGEREEDPISDPVYGIVETLRAPF